MIAPRIAAAEGPGEMDEYFEILVSTYGPRKRGVPTEGDLCWRPATDAYLTDDSFVVQMDLAGMEPAGIEVLTDGDCLVVRGIRQEVAPGGKKHFIKMEINVGPFVRRIPIPVPVDPASARATYRSGILEIVFRKGRRRPGGRRKIAIG